MKRFMIMTVPMTALSLSFAACAGNSESRENQEAASDTAYQGQPGKEMDGKGFRGDHNDGPGGISDGDRTGQGRGMSNRNSEPDEELQAILDEVQDKYQLLTIGWGGVIWATAGEQARHLCFNVV